MRDIIEQKLYIAGLTPEEMFSMSDDDMLDKFCSVFNLAEPTVNEKLAEENAKLKEELKRLYGVDRPFICGDVGELDSAGLRDFYLIAPAYGADGFAIYKKHKDYSAPEY